MVSRRAFLMALAGAPLAACNSTHMAGLPSEGGEASWYAGTMPDHPFPIPLVDRRYLPTEYLPQTVSYQGGERPGTIIVDIDQRFLSSSRATAPPSGTRSASGVRASHGRARPMSAARAFGRAGAPPPT